MSTSWEINPDTRRKLLEIQKRDGNSNCCDCNAPAPQWASPKFGIFICLTCAGIHRGLGVHISFVRSVTMDSFKNSEIIRMEKGGNNKCKAFFEKSPEFHEAMTLSERYSAEFAEDYKEKLTAEIEGIEWVKTERPKQQSRTTNAQRSTTSISTAGGSSTTLSQKERNEAYFQRLHEENDFRPADLPPSQGGKYSGFGSTPAPEVSHAAGGGLGGLEEITRDPVAALTKSWSFFTSHATKAAQIASEQVLKPTAQALAEADLTRTLGQSVSGVGRMGYENLSKFVEGPKETSRRSGPDPEHKDFWESFGEPVAAPAAKPSALGTSAMKKPATSSTVGVTAAAKKIDDDDWDKF